MQEGINTYISEMVAVMQSKCLNSKISTLLRQLFTLKLFLSQCKEDQEQARMIKESSKERERRRSYPDLGLAPGDHISCWSAATSYSDISAANTGAADNTSVNSSGNMSCLMSGGGLLTTCEARDAAWQRQAQDTCEVGATWQRKLETDHLYYTTTTPIF